MERKTEGIEFGKYKFYVGIGSVMSILLIVLSSYMIIRYTAATTYQTTLSVKKNLLLENVESFLSYLDVCMEDYVALHPDASREELEEEMSLVARKLIYSEAHVDGTYMWVQKVLQYEGGDQYAVRLIHPNLPDTEGEYLSTNTVDSNGQKPYEEELKGIQAEGAVYLTYHFKKLNSQEVSEKVTYSRLYQPFDWIVCMGVNLDDLEHYQKQAMESAITPLGLILLFSTLVWMALIYLMFGAYGRKKHRFFEKQNQELSDQLERDTVSGAGSRVRGQKLLEQAFRAYRSSGKNRWIAMLDIDYFKQFNDNYGHALGDQVLRAFASAVRDCLHEEDAVIRWGGDEFIGLISQDQKTLAELGDQILTAIRSISLPEIKEGPTVTASIGITCFLESDESLEEARSRADAAVYQAKKDGRNNWRAIPPT